MDWTSFFAGATAMLFVGVLIIILIPLKKDKDSEKWHIVHRQDMKQLHDYWFEANQISQIKIDVLRKIATVLQNIAKK